MNGIVVATAFVPSYAYMQWLHGGFPDPHEKNRSDEGYPVSLKYPYVRYCIPLALFPLCFCCHALVLFNLGSTRSRFSLLVMVAAANQGNICCISLITNIHMKAK